MRLGLDTYSLRWQGWDAFKVLEYAASLGLDNVQFSERGALASLDQEYLEELKRRAGELGLSVELGMLSFDRFSSFFRPEYGCGEQQLSDLVRAAATVGSPSVRCVLGGRAERLGSYPFQQHIEEFLRVLRSVAPLAGDLGIRVALENHGGVDFLARELRSLVETADTGILGVCLDTGNPTFAAEDPVVSAEILAPYLVTTQVRDTRVWPVAEGAMVQWVPLGQGNVDLSRICRILSERAPDVAFNIEIITADEPTAIPYADPGSDFWRAYPGMLACDFARFVSLVQTGRAEPLDQLTLPPVSQAPSGARGHELRRQQRRHFEQSVRYARDVLELGARDKGDLPCQT